MAVSTVTRDVEGGHRLSDHGRELDQPITLDSTNADAGAGVSGLFRSGNVVVKKSGGSTYVEADDATAEVSTRASVTSTNSSFTSGGTTFKWKRNGVEHTVTNTTGTGTVADWVTDLNADAHFAADLIADDSSGLRIRSLRAGEAESFQITDGTLNADAAFTEDAIISGSDADVRITEEHGQVTDDSGAAKIDNVTASRNGHYSLANLIIGGTKGATLDPEHRAILERRGCIFDA